MPDLPSEAATLGGAFPSALRSRTRWTRLTSQQIPALIAHPDPAGAAVPVMLWLHGRTASKELDPGRYLRWIRAGIAACAVDLPGHGERSDPRREDGASTLDIVDQAVDEIDSIVTALESLPKEFGALDCSRMGIGGMSAGGMATLARLCRPHRFRCAAVEATSGSWSSLSPRLTQEHHRAAIAALLDPIRHLDGWRDIPLQALHARGDQWVPLAGQLEFLDALRSRASDPSLIELHLFDETGAPFEHIGFGSRASEAKDLQVAFLKRHL